MGFRLNPVKGQTGKSPKISNFKSNFVENEGEVGELFLSRQKRQLQTHMAVTWTKPVKTHL